ncbi:hypothetical protein HDU76_012419, partial [Blyttiomyces sp. JEL0837]
WQTLLQQFLNMISPDALSNSGFPLPAFVVSVSVINFNRDPTISFFDTRTILGSSDRTTYSSNSSTSALAGSTNILGSQAVPLTPPALPMTPSAMDDDNSVSTPTNGQPGFRGMSTSNADEERILDDAPNSFLLVSVNHRFPIQNSRNFKCANATRERAGNSDGDRTPMIPLASGWLLDVPRKDNMPPSSSNSQPPKPTNGAATATANPTPTSSTTGGNTACFKGFQAIRSFEISLIFHFNKPRQFANLTAYPHWDPPSTPEGRWPSIRSGTFQSMVSTPANTTSQGPATPMGGGSVSSPLSGDINKFGGGFNGSMDSLHQQVPNSATPRDALDGVVSESGGSSSGNGTGIDPVQRMASLESMKSTSSLPDVNGQEPLSGSSSTKRATTNESIDVSTPQAITDSDRPNSSGVDPVNPTLSHILSSATILASPLANVSAIAASPTSIFQAPVSNHANIVRDVIRQYHALRYVQRGPLDFVRGWGCSVARGFRGASGNGSGEGDDGNGEGKAPWGYRSAWDAGFSDGLPWMFQAADRSCELLDASPLD